MDRTRLLSALALGGSLLFGGSVLAAEEAPAVTRTLVTKSVPVVRRQDPTPQPPPQAEPQPPFVPIVDGRLIAYYRPYPSSYAEQLLAAYGYFPPFGAYLHDARYGYNPQLFRPGDYPLERSRRVLIVVEPMDVPGTLYYYNSFPYYYGQPGYFPGNAYGDQYVTIVSPTVPQQQEQQGKQPPAQEVRVPAELAKAAFVSTLSPMLGGSERVQVDFAVGELKLRQADYGGAVEALRRAVGATPDDAAPKLALGLALTGTSDYEGAAQILKRGLRGMPDWRGLRLRAGAAFADEAAYEEVLKALKQVPTPGKDVHFLLGVLALMTGRYGDAVNDLAQAGLDDPLVLGLMLEAQRRDEAATKAAPKEPAAGTGSAK